MKKKTKLTIKKLHVLLVLAALTTLQGCLKIKTNRVVKAAKPHIEYMNKLNRLVEKNGVNNMSLTVTNGFEDPTFVEVFPLLERDSEHFDEVSDKKRHKGIDTTKDIDSILWLDCEKKNNHNVDSTPLSITDLDIYFMGGFSNIAFHDKDSSHSSSDFYLSEDDYRESIAEAKKNGESLWVEYALDHMKNRHERYKYLAVIKNLYSVEPVVVEEKKFMPGYKASKVSVYKIESEELYKEFMVYATNSDNVYQGTRRVEYNGRKHDVKWGGVYDDLNSNFLNELFFQLRENGLYNGPYRQE